MLQVSIRTGGIHHSREDTIRIGESPYDLIKHRRVRCQYIAFGFDVCLSQTIIVFKLVL